MMKMKWLELGLGLEWFRARNKHSAAVAKERLQVVIAHQRAGRANGPEYLPRLQRELLDVIRRYVTVGDDAIHMHVERDNGLEVLELNITLPET